MNPSDQKHSEYSEEWLSAYIDNELTDAQRAIVEQRIANDSDARRLLNELQHMRGLIGQLPSWSGGLIDHARVTELSLHSESFPERLEQACRLHDEASRSNLEALAGRVNAAGDVARRDVSWWRPIALAACLALLTGGGIWWWQAESATTLATSARTTERLDDPARDEASPVPQLQSAPEAFGVEATEVVEVEAMRDKASQSDVGMSGGMGGGMGRAMMGHAATGALEEATETDLAEAGMSDSSAEAIVADSPSAARLQLAPPAEEPMQGFAPPALALRSAGRSDDQSDDLYRSPAGRSGLAKSSAVDPEAQNGQPQRRLSSNDRSSAVQVQLAYSAGWSPAEVTRALQRLAPLLNVPSGSGSESGDSGPTADIPIALIAQRPSAEQAIPLMDVLSQQAAVTLQQVAPSEAQNFMQYMPLEPAVAAEDRAAGNSATTTADQADRPANKPAAAAPESSPAVALQVAPTVALFVLREEAEQILQAARQSGEMQANPVWITSANGSTTPTGPKQQVVLLFTPQ